MFSSKNYFYHFILSKNYHFILKFLSNCFASYNWITGDDIQDTGCPLKLFKKEVVKSFYLYEGMHRFLPTLAKINGFKVIEVPVQHFDRKYGQSKYGVWNRLWKGLKDAFAVRWMAKRKINYQLLVEMKD